MKTLLFLVWIIFCVISEPKQVNAGKLKDSFSFLNYDLWSVNENGGNVGLSNDGILLTSQGYFFPFIYDKFDNRLIPDTGDFNLKVRFRYKGINCMGDGIGFGYFKNSNLDTLIEYGVWADTNLGFIYMENNFSLQGTCNNISTFNDGFNRKNISLVGLSPYDWHVFEVERVGAYLYFYLDRLTRPSYLFSLFDIGCTGRNIFLGNKYSGGSTTWSSLEIDYVQIEKGDVLDLDNTKVVILPGLGASWNVLGVLGSQDAGLKWQMPSFVKTYDNLKNEFIANGFEEGKNLFVWSYDWRQPINQIVSNFDTYLSDSNITDSDDEIILVGHSLGGMVARWWYQNNSSDTRIKKVISLGSPHYGTVDAYEAWNGGNVGGRGLSSIAFNILLLLNRDLTESPASVVQRIAPIVKDLQPVTDFTYIDGQLKDFSELTNSNAILALKNNESEISGLDDLYTVAGIGFDTREFLRLGDRNFFDKRLNIWPDGRPIERIYSKLGDGTILSGSARLGSNYYELSSNHGDLTTKAISQIMTILGLEDKDIISLGYDNFEDSMVFYIASPAHLEVVCGTRTFSSDEYGFVVVKNDGSFSSCSVRVVADGNGGDYKLVVGSSANNAWSIFSDQVLLGESDLYGIDKNGLLTRNDDVYVIFKNYCQKLLETYIGNEDLVNCVEASQAKDADKLIASVFEFRENKRDFNLSWQMLDKLVPFLRTDSVTESEANFLIKNGINMFNLVENVAVIKKEKGIDTDNFGVSSFALGEEVFKNAEEDFTSGDFGGVKARFELTKKILQQVW